MTQKSHYQAYTLRKPKLKKTHVPQCSAHFLIGLFVLMMLSFMNCWWILETDLLSVTSFGNIFSQPEGCLFVLFIVSFAVQKLLSLARLHLSIFVFISIILGEEQKKILLQFMSVLPKFSSRHKSLVIPSSFLVAFLGCSMCNIMSSANSDFFLFSNLNSFYFFFSDGHGQDFQTVLNESGESEHSSCS